MKKLNFFSLMLSAAYATLVSLLTFAFAEAIIPFLFAYGISFFYIYPFFAYFSLLLLSILFFLVSAKFKPSPELILCFFVMTSSCTLLFIFRGDRFIFIQHIAVVNNGISLRELDNHMRNYARTPSVGTINYKGGNYVIYKNQRETLYDSDSGFFYIKENKVSQVEFSHD